MLTSAARPLRVLVFEDNAADAALLRRMLAQCTEPRLVLSRAISLRTALAYAHDNECDAIVLDLSLADSAGLDSVSQISLALPRMPIVVVTGVDDPEMAVQALRRGAQDYLVKDDGDAVVIARAIRHAVERKAFERLLAERANFDALTDLVSRPLLHDRLGHGLARAARLRKRAALMYIDVDGFKRVNDTFGHDAGDEVLKGVARLLRRVARRSETLARAGADEFVVVLEDLDDIAAARLMAERLLYTVNGPLAVCVNGVRVTCSIGVAVFPSDAGDAELLLKNARTALFRARKAGSGRVRFFAETG